MVRKAKRNETTVKGSQKLTGNNLHVKMKIFKERNLTEEEI